MNIFKLTQLVKEKLGSTGRIIFSSDDDELRVEVVFVANDDYSRKIHLIEETNTGCLEELITAMVEHLKREG